MTTRVLLLLVAALSLVPAAAEAHDSRPLYVEIIGSGEGQFEVRWNVPPSVPQIGLPEVELPEDCLNTKPPITRRSDSGTLVTAVYRCPAGLGGKKLGISYPVINPSLSTLVRISWASGESRTVLGSPEDRAIELPSSESASGVMSQYVTLGVRHILEGYDHLLFLACLLLVAGTTRRVLITVTGFTLAHSVTLVASTLGWVRLAVPPVEAVIALSIVFLASEIVRERRHTITWRHPIAVSSSFGLLHGFGFAAVLGDIGLPQTEVPLALVFFNVGVELGQIAFVGSLMLLAYLVRRALPTFQPGRRGEIAAAYPVGMFAAYWFVDRVAGFWV